MRSKRAFLPVTRLRKFQMDFQYLFQNHWPIFSPVVSVKVIIEKIYGNVFADYGKPFSICLGAQFKNAMDNNANVMIDIASRNRRDPTVQRQREHNCSVFILASDISLNTRIPSKFVES